MAIDLNEMRRRLEEKRRELRESLGELTEANPIPVDPNVASEGPQDFEESAVDVNEMEDERAIRANQRELLQQVNEALARIENGTYGICTNCNKPINEKRLEAIPWASLCLDCEEELHQATD
jgi:DnaK suppressor protein